MRIKKQKGRSNCLPFREYQVLYLLFNYGAYSVHPYD